MHGPTMYTHAESPMRDDSLTPPLFFCTVAALRQKAHFRGGADFRGNSIFFLTPVIYVYGAYGKRGGSTPVLVLVALVALLVLVVLVALVRVLLLVLVLVLALASPSTSAGTGTSTSTTTSTRCEKHDTAYSVRNAPVNVTSALASAIIAPGVALKLRRCTLEHAWSHFGVRVASKLRPQLLRRCYKKRYSFW